MDREQRARLYTWFERVTQLPLLALSILIIPLLLVPEIMTLSHGVTTTIRAFDWAIWSVFAMELSIRTYLAEERSRYLRRHWFDVAIVVLPFLRPLRLARSARALRAVGILRVFTFLTRISQTVSAVLEQNGLRYVFLVGLIMLLGCSVLVEHLESSAGGNIVGLPDALWWATTTITTVGYGDHYPITAEGRAIAALLMVSGITMFSIITADLAVFFSRQRTDVVSNAELVREIRLLRQRVEELAGTKTDEEAVPV